MTFCDIANEIALNASDQKSDTIGPTSMTINFDLQAKQFCFKTFDKRIYLFFHVWNFIKVSKKGKPNVAK